MGGNLGLGLFILLAGTGLALAILHWDKIKKILETPPPEPSEPMEIASLPGWTALNHRRNDHNDAQATVEGASKKFGFLDLKIALQCIGKASHYIYPHSVESSYVLDDERNRLECIYGSYIKVLEPNSAQEVKPGEIYRFHMRFRPFPKKPPKHTILYLDGFDPLDIYLK